MATLVAIFYSSKAAVVKDQEFGFSKETRLCKQ